MSRTCFVGNLVALLEIFFNLHGRHLVFSHTLWVTRMKNTKGRAESFTVRGYLVKFWAHGLRCSCSIRLFWWIWGPKTFKLIEQCLFKTSGRLFNASNSVLKLRSKHVLGVLTRRRSICFLCPYQIPTERKMSDADWDELCASAIEMLIAIIRLDACIYLFCGVMGKCRLFIIPLHCLFRSQVWEIVFSTFERKGTTPCHSLRLL